mgnify:CR=1 FL=1
MIKINEFFHEPHCLRHEDRAPEFDKLSFYNSGLM